MHVFAMNTPDNFSVCLSIYLSPHTHTHTHKHRENKGKKKRNLFILKIGLIIILLLLLLLLLHLLISSISNSNNSGFVLYKPLLGRGFGQRHQGSPTPMAGDPILNRRGLTKHVGPASTVKDAGIVSTTGRLGFRVYRLKTDGTVFVAGTLFYGEEAFLENGGLQEHGLHAAPLLDEPFDGGAFKFDGTPPLSLFGGPTPMSGISSVGFKVYRGWFHGCWFHGCCN